MTNGSGQDERLPSHPVHFHHSTGTRIQEANPGVNVWHKSRRGQDSLHHTAGETWGKMPLFHPIVEEKSTNVSNSFKYTSFGKPSSWSLILPDPRNQPLQLPRAEENQLDSC